jgi:hypothetical protein
MSRPEDEVKDELIKIGYTPDAKSLRVLAQRLAATDCIVDTLKGRARLESCAPYEAWLLVMPERMLYIAIDSGGWFSEPSARYASVIEFSDVLEIRFDFNNGQRRWDGTPNHDVIVKTGSMTHRLEVPTAWASEEAVRAFAERLRERCRVESAPALGSEHLSFAAEMKLLADLRAGGHLTNEKAAEAIRKLTSK